MRIRTRVAAAMIAAAALAAKPFVAAQESAQAAPGLEQAQAIARADTGVGQYYTAAQALRGQVLYNRHCGYCHYANAGTMPTISGIRGRPLAPRYLQRADDGIARYPSVYYLSRRLDAMPPNDVDSVTPQQKVNILAYLLQQNGLMAGPSELKADHGLMKEMPLPAEPGFVHLFNGRDFNGWQFLLGFHCTAPPAGCGKTDPSPVFFVNEGVFATTGKIHGMAYTTKKYKNFTVRLEQRFPMAWDDIDDLVQGNTGMFVFLGSKGGAIRIWGDNMIEVQGKYHQLLSISGLGALRVNPTVDRDARRRALKPVNQWQRIEIVSQGGVLTNYLNGALISTAELPADLDPGYFAFQSEGIPVEWRNIRIKEE